MSSAHGLLLRKLCGEISCPDYTLCNHQDEQCYSCASYCDETSQNYHVNDCERHCQDYIHDYIKHYAKENTIQEALHELDSLNSLIIFMTFLVTAALIFSIITLGFIFVLEKRMKRIGQQRRPYLNSMVSAQFAQQFPQNKNLVSTVNEEVAADKKTPAANAEQSDLMMASSSSLQMSGESNSICPTFSLMHEDGTLDFSGYNNLTVSWAKEQ